jgi:succinate dehydrogenase / fumarate reductase cytochrome b subunit
MVMALTGAILIAFLIVHLAGNLLIFGGQAINSYAAFLKQYIVPVWIARAVLLLAALLHVLAGTQLTLLDWSARPVPYQARHPQAATWSSRTMRWGGLVIALFVIFHLLHLTTGTIRPESVPFASEDIRSNVNLGFRIGWVSALYLIALIAVGLHLYHGAWASYRTAGLARPSSEPARRPLAAILAVVLWLGFTIIPLAIFFAVAR